MQPPRRLPLPEELGFNPERFPFWRPAQYKALRWLLSTEKRFAAVCAPTGIGKSLLNLGYARLNGARTVVLTSTNTLLDQLVRDFSDLPSFQDVRGKRNYPCTWNPTWNITADRAPCNIGMDCVLREINCPFYSAFSRAIASELVVTNYQWWLNQVSYGQGIGDVDCLILDEAHRAPDELAKFLSVALWHEELLYVGGCVPHTGVREWAARWAKTLAQEVKDSADSLMWRVRVQREEMLRKKSLAQKLERLSSLPESAWIRSADPKSTRWDLINPAAKAEILFQGASKVIFSSATITPKTLEYLNVKPSMVDFREFDSPFPAARRPVYIMPTVKVNYGTSDEEYRLLVNRLDRILDDRADRRGIVHVSSYRYAQRIVELSRHAHAAHLHRRGTVGVEETLAEFRDSPPPAWLVSPALKEGVDLPYEQCEVVVEAKLPWPNPYDPIVAARTSIDPDYGRYQTLSAVVQGMGRGMRSEDDACEGFILDASVRGLWHCMSEFAPKSFREAVVWADGGLPPAPPALGSAAKTS